MSREKHAYVEDPALPGDLNGCGVCVCGLPERNAHHDDRGRPTPAEAQAAHLARYDHEVVVPPS